MTKSDPITIELPSQNEMLQAVGRGIQAFAMVETVVGFLFADLMEPADRASSIIALDAAGQFAAKQRVICAVAKHKLSGEALKKFNTTMKRCESPREFRNKLAHWTVGYWPGANTAEEMKRIKVALTPPLSSPKHGAVVWGKEQPIHLKQIEEFIVRCNALFRDLVALSNSISSPKSRPLKTRGPGRRRGKR